MLALVKITVVFIFIIVMLRRKISIGITMMAATVFLGAIFGLGLEPLVKQFFYTFVDRTTIELMAALVLIMIMESVMRKTGMLEKMTKSLFVFPFSQRVLVSLIPAIIGLLPSAGGARFSAPLVEQVMDNVPYRAEEKVFINFWFRHIWEYSLPLYPGLILAAHLSGVSLGSLIMIQWPISLIWVLTGYWFVFKKRKAGGCNTSENINKNSLRIDESDSIWKTIKMLALNTWPIWVTVLIVVFGVSIGLAIGIVLAALIIQKRYPLLGVIKTLKEPLTASIVFLIWGTLAFKDVLSLSGAIIEISNYISSVGIPFLPVLMILPAIAGMLTGIVQASVGVSFPLIMSMIEPTAGYVMLAYVAGVVGVMISPVHLCLVLTVDYFRADFLSSYRSLLAPSLTVIVFAMGLFWIL